MECSGTLEACQFGISFWTYYREEREREREREKDLKAYLATELCTSSGPVH